MKLLELNRPEAIRRATSLDDATLTTGVARLRPRAEHSGAIARTSRFVRPRSVYLRDSAQEQSVWQWRANVAFSRHLFRTFGIVRGAILDIATNATVDGWRPQFVGEDSEWGERAEDFLDEWFKICDVRGEPYDFHTNLFLASVLLDVDGDFACVLVNNEESFPQIQPIAAHRIATPPSLGDGVIRDGAYAGNTLHNGIIFNNVGRAVAFCVQTGSINGEFQIISAFDMGFWFAPDTQNQLRGAPAFTHAAQTDRAGFGTDAQDIQDIQHYLKHAVKLDATIGIIEENETGEAHTSDWGISENDAAKEHGVIVEDIDAASIRYLRANSGNKLTPFLSSRPDANVPAFIEHIVRGIYQGIGYPYELRDPSKIGGANVRMILERAHRAIMRRQLLLEKIANRITRWRIALAIKRGELPPNDEWWRWDWQLPAQLTVDKARESAQARENYKLGFGTARDWYAAQGKWWEDEIRQRVREAKFIAEEARRAGVDPRSVQLLTPNEPKEPPMPTEEQP